MRARQTGGVSNVPRDLERLVDEIDGWLELRCPDKALDRLQPLLERADARTEGLVLRVRAYVATKKHREALADLQELRRTDHDPDWLDLTEAWCRKRMQDLPGAVRCMEQLLQRNPKSAIGHFNLGCYLSLRGDKERALDEVTLACGLDASFRDLLWDEPDLDRLHKDSRFKALAEPPEDATTADPDGAADEAALEEGEEDFEDGEDEDLADDDEEGQGGGHN